MKYLPTKVKTAYSLGLSNILYVIFHRLKAKTGFDSTRHLSASVPSGPFFSSVETVKSNLVASDDWNEHALYFGWWPRPITNAPPDWHQNPMNQERASADRVWSDLPDFDARVGDIKLVWEASRFSWVLAFAQRVSLGDSGSLTRLNDWITDWCVNNPPFFGANWKCGQEASIRTLHLAMASVILGQAKKSQIGLIDFIKLHLQRIAPTLRYAISQDNNHGTSEAAALFVGGSWLDSHGVSEGKYWEKLGRKWLENRAARLIGVDGSFSQYSVNYHRVVLDTFSMVEVWRRHLALPDFSKQLRSRLIAAAQWLAALVDQSTGDAPNVGANDSARLLPLTDGDGRDFRPSAQLAMVLFAGCQTHCLPNKDEDVSLLRGSSESNDSELIKVWNVPLYWLGIRIPDAVIPAPMSQVFDNGGYAVLRNKHAMALLRYPRFRFRPSQADLLHVDLWRDGINLLRDAGTYSYNAEPQYQRYFPSTKSHNTIEFDGRDQMPRLSRFLFGDWLKTKTIEPLQADEESVSFAASYCDSQGVSHERRIMLTDSKLKISDQIGGFTTKAILRWRLAPGHWQIKGEKIINHRDHLNIRATMPIIRMQLVTGWESRYYLQKTDTTILEIEFAQPGTIVSEYEWML